MFRLAISAIIAAMLVSCATKPPPQTEPPAKTTVIVRDTVRTTITDTLKVTDSIFIKETETFKTLQKSIDSLIAIGEKEKAVEILKTQVQSYNLKHLGARTLQLANLLHQTGRSAEALSILESFAVYKPEINSWIDSANSLFDKIIATYKTNNVEVKVDPLKQETINSLTAQIRNLKNTNANPALIVELADSLRAVAPGDSVLAWLEKQMPQSVDNSNPFCEEQRKTAADKFATARQNKTRAKALLNEAIEALDKCLARTPSADMRNKVIQNRQVLVKEMEKY